MSRFPTSRRLVAFAFVLIASLAGSIPNSRGAAITPWSGASAQAGSDRETGATASASDLSTKQVEFSSGYSGPGGGYFTTESEDATAVAGGSPEALLQIGTRALVEATGFAMDGVYSGTVTASAGWADDAVQITTPAGLPMPESIRLQFRYNFNPEDNSSYSSARGYFYYGYSRLQMNDKILKVSGTNSDSPGYEPEWFDSVTEIYGTAVGTLHLDLSVDESGLSDPFSLSLEAQSSAFSNSGTGLFNYHSNRLSLTGVTLTDGRSLGALGYGVSFISGLPSPEPVPEPASVALWSIVAIAGVAVARHRSRG